jgi:hypothetical protein
LIKIFQQKHFIGGLNFCNLRPDAPDISVQFQRPGERAAALLRSARRASTDYGLLQRGPMAMKWKRCPTVLHAGR